MIDMSGMAIAASTSNHEDWLFASVILLVSYGVVYPLYLLLVRVKHTRRIKRQLVTSLYRPPIDMSPAELSYVFSTRVAKQQLYGTLLDLANRSLIILEKKSDGKIMARIGPKSDKQLKLYEKLLYQQVLTADGERDVEKIMQGLSSYKPIGSETVRGSRQYVFWWLLREDLRSRKLIAKRMKTTYLKMLFHLGVVWSLVLATVPLVLFHIVQMIQSGKVDVSVLGEVVWSGLLLWTMALPLLVVVSFFLLRFKGQMLGREWLMTRSFKRYLNQLEAYREFVRLTHADKLHFESKELKREARASTRPFAIAFGYVKD